VDIFSGTLTLDDGGRVPVDLGLDAENLTLRTDGRMIGTWPLKYCRVAPSGRGAVLLSLDGEKAAFEPVDLAGFSTVAAQRFRASSLADRISVIRDVPVPDSSPGALGDGSVGERRSRPWMRIRLRWVAIGLGALGLFVVGVVVFALLTDDDTVEFAGTTITVPTTLAPPPPLFEQTLEQFTNEWNLNASAFGVPVQVRGVLIPGTFESQLTSHLTLQGRTDVDGKIASLVFVIDPSGDTADDELALSALGVAIAVANPELERPERAAVLAAMGLSVRQPDLTGLDGEVEVGSVRYSIAYFPAFGSLLFTVNPA
jgi:hypothetical protein